ncbi:MAG: threonine synthase [Gemmatimonadetes bacterium]|nr:threonine synthase [Gemmatimonadota bacterium]
MPFRSVPPNVIELRCLACGALIPADFTATTCPAPGHEGERGILDVRYDYERARRDFPTGDAALLGPSVWRWRAVLPVNPPTATLLSAGDTPLVSAPRLAKRLGLAELWLKDDTRNPTRSFKDRATAVGMAIAIARGYPGVTCASAGNAAISLAGFAAHAGIPCTVFVPSYASAERLRWLERFGATVHVSTGNYDQAFDECEAFVDAKGWYNRNCAYNPFLVEGKKTAAFEIAAQLGNRIPDAVVCAVGDGCTLGAIGKGFRELRAMGMTVTLPQLVGVQAETVSPLVARQHGASWTSTGAATAAASIAVQRPRNAVRVLHEVKECRGTLLAVSEARIAEAQAAYAREAGVVVEAATATTLAGLEALVADGQLAGARVVAVLTGNRD